MHLGSLYTAVGSFLDARAHRGRWLLRIEDLDRARETPGSMDGILRTLEAFGLHWDGPAERQSAHTDRYGQALADLRNRGLTFECSCTRAQLEEEPRYPGTCRDGPIDPAAMTATRLRVGHEHIGFIDRIQGQYAEDVAEAAGDIVLKRRDQVIAYVLAVVVDDARQGVTHIVRGADLLDNTPRQILLQRRLGLPTPIYAHLPVLTEPDGTKLAKSRRSVAVEPCAPLSRLLAVLALLGLDTPPELFDAKLEEALGWAISAWDVRKVPKCLELQLPD